MTTSRREFLQVTGSAAMFGVLPLTNPNTPSAFERAATSLKVAEFDQRWTRRMNVKHKAVLDVPEIDSGYGVWRASVWMLQYRDALGAAEKDLRTVLVLRHNGIALAMTQAFWDEYGIGKKKGALHPLTQQPTDRNPALLGESDGLPAPFSTFALDKFMAGGGIVLACNLAFDDCVGAVKAKHGLTDDAARVRTLTALVPGVILQPSGIFAAIRAQEAGAVYVRAS
jgi:hypothetical protein